MLSFVFTTTARFNYLRFLVTSMLQHNIVIKDKVMTLITRFCLFYFQHQNCLKIWITQIISHDEKRDYPFCMYSKLRGCG